MGCYSILKMRPEDLVESYNGYIIPETPTTAGTEIQFYGGNDFFQVFYLGDTVPWSIDKECPGTGNFLDGVYEGVGDGQTYWIVVNNHKICALRRMEDDEDERFDLADNYGIEPYDRAWWSEDQWFRQELDDAERDTKNRSENYQFLLSIQHLSTEERHHAKMVRFGKLMAAPIARNLDYAGVARRAVIIDPLPDGELPIFDKPHKLGPELEQEFREMRDQKIDRGVFEKIAEMAKALMSKDGK